MVKALKLKIGTLLRRRKKWKKEKERKERHASTISCIAKLKRLERKLKGSQNTLQVQSNLYWKL